MAEETIKQQEEIKVIDDSVEAVRKLPDVYIGALGSAGFLNMYREILQNSLDEIIKGHTLDKNIIVSYDARNFTCIIEDNGQGIDLKMLDKVYSVLHSSSNYDKVAGSGNYSAGKNGMGGTITNFLSKFFVAESYRMDGSAAKVEFNEGKLTSKGIQKIKPPKGKHGMVVSFAPSAMMGEINVSDIDIEELTWNITHLCSLGTRVAFNAITLDGKKRSTIIENKRGIYEILDRIAPLKLTNPIYFTCDNGTMKVEILVAYSSTALASEEEPETLISGFANMCPSNEGTHIDGFLDGIVKYFRDYMNKIYLANNKKLQVTAADIRTGLRAVVSVYHLFPLFTGQSKEKFSKDDMKQYAYEATLKGLAEWAKNNPIDLQKISKYLKDVCEVRMSLNNSKIKMSEKYNTSAISDLPFKYKRPNKKGPFELWIVEGDSCASAMENVRDKTMQGVFPIRGKMLNPFVTPVQRYFDNEEVAGIFHICGYKGYAKKFDPAQFKPSKVIIATDADADGSHIQCLVFGLFLRYLPDVIRQGKLYVANPPLYGATIKGKQVYFANNRDYIEYVQGIFCKQNTVSNMKGKNYSKKDIVKILYNNMNYKDELYHVATTYAIEPYFLEFLLMNRKLDYKKFKSKIEKAYRFVKVSVENGITMVRGLVESKWHTVFFDQRLFTDCKEIIRYLDSSEDEYMINGQVYTLLGLMNLFSEFIPKGLTRYKGRLMPSIVATQC